jgi:branched-subunit amino acid transport protein|tara:strand:- start:235 stop:546 length:312 start_codon:yes stop_codon:yes gene_type:complete
MIWIKMILAGIITFLTRFLMINLIKKNSLSARTKVVLSYVPSAVFPAIIFPAIFLDLNGQFLLEDNPKIIGAIVAIVVGYFSKNTLATIILGLISYWTYIYLV